MRYFIILSIWLLLNPGHVSATEAWPVMREFELSIGIRLNSDRIDIDIPFYDEEGKIQYRFICRGGDYDEYLTKFGPSYMPQLTCILNPGSHETNYSLLGEDDSEAYFSRGRIGFEQLIGECGAYPEYGLLRHFRLRGFELTLQFSDVILATENQGQSATKGPAVSYTVMKISLKRDPTAKTANAARPGYLPPTRPGASCDVVEKGFEPLMCRNPETFNWEECPPGWEYERAPWEAKPAPPNGKPEHPRQP